MSLLWILGIVGTLGTAGTIAAAIAFPAVVIPILKAIVGALLRCKPCMAVLAAIGLLFAGALYGVHVERQRIEVRLERQRVAAAEAAKERDKDIRADLEKSFAPALDAQRALTRSLQEKVNDYEKRKMPADKVAAGKVAANCKLGDAAGVLQSFPPRGPAGAAQGGIADHLRRNSRSGTGAGSKPGR